MRTVYAAAGGEPGLNRLAAAWHARVMADPVVSHAFSHGFHPDHTRRLAAYWTEALGGPPAYSSQFGDESGVLRLHSGNGRHEEMDARAIACFDRALADVGLTADDELRQTLHGYFAWATTTSMDRYPDSAADVPINLDDWRSRWSLTPFLGLARSITGQQISGRVAEAIFGRLVAFIGDRDPATAIAAASDADLRAVGLSGNKMRSLRDLAERTIDGRLQLDRIERLPDDEARAQLTAVRGIGPWTADIFLLAQLGRPDILPAGDLGVRNAVQRSHGLDHLPSEAEVRAIGEAWSPYRSLATAYLYSSLREA